MLISLAMKGNTTCPGCRKYNIRSANHLIYNQRLMHFFSLSLWYCPVLHILCWFLFILINFNLIFTFYNVFSYFFWKVLNFVYWRFVPLHEGRNNDVGKILLLNLTKKFLHQSKLLIPWKSFFESASFYKSREWTWKKKILLETRAQKLFSV